MRFQPLPAIAVITLLWCFPCPGDASEATVVSTHLKGQRLNELAIWNLGADKTYEIFVTSVSGRAACYAADTLDQLWEREITKQSLTAPVLGNFMGTGAPLLAFASSSGTVYFMWPGTGEVISSLETGLPFSLAPSVAAMPEGDKLVVVADHGQIAVLDVHPETGLARQRWIIPNTLSGAAAFSVVGQISLPAACADINGDGTPEIIVTSDSGVLQVVSLSDPPQRYYTRLPQQSRATTLAAVGDLSGTGQNVIIQGVNATLQLFTWDPAQGTDKAVLAFLTTPAFGGASGHLLLGPINADIVPDLVSTADSTVAARYLGNDFSGKQAFLDIATQHLTTAAAPFSPAIGITRRDGVKSVVAIDSDGVAWNWDPATPDNTVSRVTGVPVPTGFTPAGDLTGNGKLSLVVWNQKAASLSLVTLPVDLAPMDPAAGGAVATGPALTLGVNYSRNGQWGPDWAREWQARLQQSAAALASIRSGSEAGPTAEDSVLTTDSVSAIAGLDPLDPVSISFRKKHRASGFSTGIVVAGLAVLVIIAALGYRRFRHSRR